MKVNIACVTVQAILIATSHAAALPPNEGLTVAVPVSNRRAAVPQGFSQRSVNDFDDDDKTVHDYDLTDGDIHNINGEKKFISGITDVNGAHGVHGIGPGGHNGHWGNGNWGNGDWGNGNWGNGHWGNGDWGNGHWGNGHWGNGDWGNGRWGSGNGHWGSSNGHWGSGNGHWGTGNGHNGKWNHGFSGKAGGLPTISHVPEEGAASTNNVTNQWIIAAMTIVLAATLAL